MPAKSNIFRDPKPTEPRLRVDLPCQLGGEAFRVMARVCNINHSGLQVALSAEAADIAVADIDGDGLGARERLDSWFRAAGRFP